jgi:hypothetical protein
VLLGHVHHARGKRSFPNGFDSGVGVLGSWSVMVAS